mmetsp:Transcript_67469/g.160967  ORF Transcript_67469/g.160967 Transcript_67469/m.160967 type:complete len:126 (-) Transcript_67469:106-483(-)
MLRLFACLVLTNVLTVNAKRSAIKHLADVEKDAVAAAEVSENKIEEHVMADKTSDKVSEKQTADHVTTDKVVSKHSVGAKAADSDGCHCHRNGQSCVDRFWHYGKWSCDCVRTRDNDMCKRCYCI